jgi:hypothetical protein
MQRRGINFFKNGFVGMLLCLHLLLLCHVHILKAFMNIRFDRITGLTGCYLRFYPVNPVNPV